MRGARRAWGIWGVRSSAGGGGGINARRHLRYVRRFGVCQVVGARAAFEAREAREKFSNPKWCTR
eukprot:9823082-Lingulodinium_polyedra.AAC.1